MVVRICQSKGHEEEEEEEATAEMKRGRRTCPLRSSVFLSDQHLSFKGKQKSRNITGKTKIDGTHNVNET